LSDEAGCKRSLEITIPVEEVERETDRVIASLRAKVRLPGFRPGKVPVGLLRGKFASEIRQEVLEALVPKALRAEVEKDNLDIVGEPNITKVNFERGEPIEFTAEIEVAPEVELEEYREIEVPYEEPDLTEQDMDERFERMREERAEYINVDPRPVEKGDYAVISLKSIGGIEGEPIENDEMTLHVGGEDTLADFTSNVTGMQPDEEKEFDVAYPEEYGEDRLAGKTVRFAVKLKTIRKKELPELNDEFAKDLGDYKDLDELREAVRSAMKGEREFVARQQAQGALVEKLIDMHDFPVPDAFVERQLDLNLEQRVREMMAQGVDPRQLDVDWKKVRESQRERATRDVKASMILDRISEREAVEVTQDEVDRQVQRIAQQRREPAPAVRKELEEAGELSRIASRIRTEKTLNVLFEHARKVAPEKLAAAEAPSEEAGEEMAEE